MILGGGGGGGRGWGSGRHGGLSISPFDFLISLLYSNGKVWKLNFGSMARKLLEETKSEI